jgi:hypothetical protein
MAFKLTKDEMARIAKGQEILTSMREGLEEVINGANEAIGPIIDQVNYAITSWNEARQTVYDFLEDIVNEHEDAFDEKSEKWQEGERGEATREWIDNLDNLKSEYEENIDEVTFDTISMPDLPDIDDLGNIESEPSY